MTWGWGVECRHTAEVLRFRCEAPEPSRLVCSFLLCPVVLNAPDTVLIERNMGKRIDPDTGGMMAPPSPQGTQKQQRAAPSCPLLQDPRGPHGSPSRQEKRDIMGARQSLVFRELDSLG